ncbi:MAG: ribosomal RNA small subunit methyltransferase A [Candidatus Peribacteraceae bacterium]|nr:ribosomal RNA small subunit methyltransferase A [Candidatus Peribacteraceae bacterium]
MAARIGDFCKANRLRLNTDLGQHFLIDESVLDAVVAESGLQPGDRAVEIGPGIGVLTERLLQLGANVTAVELDQRMLPLLKRFTALDGEPHPALTIIQGNALAVPFPDEPYRIVANIPYHITSPLLRHAFLESPRAPLSLTLLIQREVAERICDKEDRGLLTIVVALFGEARLIRTVPPGAFLPPPAVDSAVIRIDCYEKPLVERDVLDHLLWTLKMAFHQKRKMLRTTVGRLPGGAEALEAAGIAGDRRPQTLSPEEWIAVAARLPGPTSA